MVVHILAQDQRVGSLNRLAAGLGFAELGEEVRWFEDAAFDALPLHPDDIVVGGVGYARKAFARLGIEVPDLEPVPPQLEPFAGRRIWRATLGEVRQRVNAGEAMFVKPAPDQPKRFIGRVLSAFRDLIATAQFDDTLVVDCAEPVTFISEYRAFVLHGELIGLRPYTGDPLAFPDPDTVRAAIAAYDPAPASYALDVGVTDDGRTLLVEVNDSYATGGYGLFPIAYARFIAARWTELRASR